MLALSLKKASLPNNFLQWIYLTYPWIPDGKVWLRWCLRVKACRASIISKSADFSECLFFFFFFGGGGLCMISIFSGSSPPADYLNYTDAKLDRQYSLLRVDITVETPESRLIMCISAYHKKGPKMALGVSFRKWFVSLPMFLMFWLGYIVHMLG